MEDRHASSIHRRNIHADILTNILFVYNFNPDLDRGSYVCHTSLKAEMASTKKASINVDLKSNFLHLLIFFPKSLYKLNQYPSNNRDLIRVSRK